MADLTNWLQEMELARVKTYLNSGNVLFDSDQELRLLTGRIAAMIEARCGQKVPILIKTSQDMIQIAQSIPQGWQNDGTQQTYVAYLFDEVANEEILASLPIKGEFVEIYYFQKAVIWNIKRENYHKSQITKLANHPAYGSMTTRNVNTARKLAELCQGGEPKAQGPSTSSRPQGV